MSSAKPRVTCHRHRKLVERATEGYDDPEYLTTREKPGPTVYGKPSFCI
jgi:hypothetical protein